MIAFQTCVHMNIIRHSELKVEWLSLANQAHHQVSSWFSATSHLSWSTSLCAWCLLWQGKFGNEASSDAVEADTSRLIPVAKFTDDQNTTINQSVAERLDPRVFVTCKQLTNTLRSKRPALDWLIVVYCSSVNFATSKKWLGGVLDHQKAITIQSDIHFVGGRRTSGRWR